MVRKDGINAMMGSQFHSKVNAKMFLSAKQRKSLLAVLSRR